MYHSDIAAGVTLEGFRLPTSDEWEYGCSGTSRTLFRWGDECPLDRYPCDYDYGYAPDWDLHSRPNAFGLFIAANNYDYEVCSQPGLFRGGDGGSAACGGDASLMGWLSVATAYFCEWADDGYTYNGYFRLVYPLNQSKQVR